MAKLKNAKYTEQHCIIMQQMTSQVLQSGSVFSVLDPLQLSLWLTRSSTFDVGSDVSF